MIDLGDNEKFGMFSRDHKKLFIIGKGVFAWSITSYEVDLDNDNKETLGYIQTEFTVHKKYEDVFDEMLELLSVDNFGTKQGK